MRRDGRLAECRAQNSRLRDELAVAKQNADYWERTAHKVRARMEADRETFQARSEADAQVIRDLVKTIARYPDSLADILNPRIEPKPTVGMDSIGFDDALGQPVGMFPAFEEDPSMASNGRTEIQQQDEEWQG